MESKRILMESEDYNIRLLKKARNTVPKLADWCTLNVVEDGAPSRVLVVHRDKEKEPLLRRLCELYDAFALERDSISVLRSGMPIFLPEMPEARTQEIKNAEYTNIVGAMKTCSMMILPIVSRGETVGVLSLAYADSGRRYTKEDLDFMLEYCRHLGVMVDSARLTEELRQRDRSKDEFLATLSHELRNPLAPIKSSLEMMQLSHKDPTCKGEIGVVQRQFEHFTHIVNDLLDVTRYSRGKLHFEKKTVDLCALLRELAAMYAPHINDRKITFVSAIPGESLLMWCDPVRIKQAVMNILDNAQKFTPPGGRIYLGVEWNETSAMILIRDTGTGIKPEDLDKILDMHFPKRSSSGLGMGLMLVRRIINMHEGKVVVQSEGEGRGSEFIITLPIDDKMRRVHKVPVQKI
jgi:signal transduction histidine kinase